MDKELYEAVEAALNVYLDAARKCVGSPSETPVGWRWLNELGDRLKAIFPYHPELGRCFTPKPDSNPNECIHRFIQKTKSMDTGTIESAFCVHCGKTMLLSWGGDGLMLKETLTAEV